MLIGEGLYYIFYFFFRLILNKFIFKVYLFYYLVILRMKYVVNLFSFVRDLYNVVYKMCFFFVLWFINDIDMCNFKLINVLKWYVGLNDLFIYFL